MSTKRQPSKQRRQTQNRQQRAALEARRAAAAAGEAPAGKVGEGTPQKGESVLSRLTGSGASSRRSGPAKGPLVAARLPVGHRAALTSVMLAGASVLFVLVGFQVPISSATGDAIVTKSERVAEWSLASLHAAQGLDAEATADDVRDAVEDWSPGGKESYITALWPYSLTIFLPLVGAGLGFRAVRKRGSARLVNRTMYVTLFGALLTRELLFFFLPAVVAMAIAAFQVRKAELASVAAAADGVIDVDEVAEVEEVIEVAEVDEVVEVVEVVEVDDVIEDERTS